MTIAVCGRATMANAKRIVFDEGINIAPRKKTGREKVIDLSRRWLAEQAAQREAREDLQRTMSEHRRRRQEMTERIATDPHRLMSMVAAWHGTDVRALLSGSRSRHLVEARYDAIAAVYLLCKIDGRQYSLTELGRLFGRDHTTAHHALKMRGLK